MEAKRIQSEIEENSKNSKKIQENIKGEFKEKMSRENSKRKYQVRPFLQIVAKRIQREFKENSKGIQNISRETFPPV